MNPWDFVTWVSAVLLAGSAAAIFYFFMRDARSILNREMHDHDEDPTNSSASDPAADGASPAPPEDLSR